jgi:cytochrome c biogenesis protein ResB
MDMKFEVLTWLPDAVQRDHIVPRNVRPGAEPAEPLEPALRCTLASGDTKQEFLVRMSRRATQVKLGKETFFVRYRTDTRRLDFDLTLKNARQVSDPGTNRPAAFESDVVLRWTEDGKTYERDRRISMNNTLDHAGYKVYQTNYRPMTNPRAGDLVLDTEGQLVSMSGFTVADDPGLFCKYLGSCLLVLGIAVMFYMRAYFFKPRRAV